MPDYDNRIKEFEEELKTTKYNKRTQHHIGLVKAKIAKLKERIEKKAKGKGAGEGFAVKKSGDATVMLIGFPSVGKSTLLNAITNAESKVAGYEFTTLTVIPGTMEYEGAQIQILDVPGIIEGATEGRGKGKEILSMLQSTDLLLIIVETGQQLTTIKKELQNANIRINQEKPDIRIKKTAQGGIQIGRTVKTELSDETIKAVMQEMGISNGHILIREDITIDQLIDIMEGNKRYIPAIVAINKIDLLENEKLKELKEEIKPDILISAEKRTGTEELKKLIFEKLKLMRVYCKQISKKADLEKPLIMKEGATIRDICNKLHRSFEARFRFAKVWGSSRFPGQKQGLNYELKDKDAVQIHLR